MSPFSSNATKPVSSSIDVLQIMGSLDLGGVETFTFHLLTQLQDKDFRVGIAIHDPRLNQYYEKKLMQLGCSIYRLPNRRTNPLRYIYSLWLLIDRSNFRIIHRYCENSIGILELLPFVFRLKVIIHMVSDSSSSSSSGILKLLNKFARVISNYVPITRIACSKQSALWGFGGVTNWILIRNAIDFTRYKTPSLLEELKPILQGDWLGVRLGCIARFEEQKNLEFAVKLIAFLKKKNHPANLILVGSGSQMEPLLNLAQQLGVSNRINFLGQLEDWKVLPFIDCFLMPSRFEGVPLALIAAQVRVPNLLVSDRVSIEAIFSDRCFRLPIIPVDESVKLWGDLIMCLGSPDKHRYDHLLVKGAKLQEYDILSVSREIWGLYTKLSAS